MEKGNKDNSQILQKDKGQVWQKVRSSRACLSEGYRLYTGNFRRIFSHSWLGALVYALVCGGIGYLGTVQTQETFTTAIGDTAVVIYLDVLYRLVMLIVTAVAGAFFAAYGFDALRQHKQTGAFAWTKKLLPSGRAIRRTLNGWVWLFIISILVGIAIGGISYAAARYLPHYAAMGSTGIFTVIIAALLLPLTYTSARYVLADGIGFWKQLAQGYPAALRRWGFIFAVTFVAAVIWTALALLTSLPALILALANWEANTGVMLGDPYGMPSHIGWLTAGIFAVVGFIQAYISLAFLFPVYYLCGAIDAQEAERKDFNKQLPNP